MMKTSPKVILLGEDLHDSCGGAFNVTSALSTEFPERVISTPIGEAGVAGASIGLALDAYLTVVEIMFAGHRSCHGRRKRQLNPQLAGFRRVLY